MLKKFSDFLKPKSTIDLTFEPYVKVVSDLSLQIMKANDTHLDDLLHLEQQIYRGQTPWDRFSFKNELMKHHNSLYLVAYDGSKLVAFIGARFNETEGHVTNVAVAPEYQRRKIGTFLLNVMLDYGRVNNCELMSLEVRVDNTGAQKLYEKIGFHPNLIRKNYYFTDKVDGLNMVYSFANPKDDFSEKGVLL